MLKLTELGLTTYPGQPARPNSGRRSQDASPVPRPASPRDRRPATRSRRRCLPLAVAAVAANVAFGVEQATAQVLTVEDASATEGDAISFTFKLELDEVLPGGVTVWPTISTGTTTKADHRDTFTEAQGIHFDGVTLSAQDTLTVATIEDRIAEGDETFTVSLSLETSGTVTAPETVTGTILDDDTATVTIADASAAEGDGISFTVTLDTAVQGGLTVTPSFTDGTATKGTDYTENTAGLSFTGTAGETQSFTVATTEDTAEEPAETFTVGLSVSETRATVTATDTATGTITDNSPPVIKGLGRKPQISQYREMTPIPVEVTDPDGDTVTVTVTGLPPGLSYSGGELRGTPGGDRLESHSGLEYDVTITANDGVNPAVTDEWTIVVIWPWSELTIDATSADEGDGLTFTVTLDMAVPGGFTVTPGFTDGTATKGTDYTENTAALTFAGTAGETQTFTVATTEDTDVESDETFTVGLTVSGTSTTVTASDTATGTITNDDNPALTIADASATEGDGITFTVTLDAAVPGGLTVTPSYTAGTATKGADYTENTSALTFAGTAGEAKTFTVATTEDGAVEPDETFTVGLTVSGTSATVTATDTAAGTILNDDERARGTTDDAAVLTVADASATEGVGITFTVTLDNAVSGGVKVTPGYTDGTATKGADYTENAAALTFAGRAGEAQTFTVATTDDAAVEPDETFTVNLTVSGTSAATVTATDTATGTILDDDVPATPAVTIADTSASEGDGLTFTVTLDRAVAGGLTVTPSYADGTATQGADYTANTRGLAFEGTAGEAKTFTVATTEDSDEEPDETFTVSLSVSGTTATVTATDTATGTIVDDDVPSTPAVTIADTSADEGDGLTFTVTLDRAVAGGLTVTPSFTDVTATKGADYTENTAGIRFAGTAGETQSFTVATTEDADDESDETFTVSPDRLGDLGDGDGDRHRDGDDPRRRHGDGRPADAEDRPRLGRRGRRAHVHGDARPGGGGGPDGDAGLDRRNGDEGRGLHRDLGRAHLRGQGRRVADLHGGDDRRRRGRAGRDIHGEPDRLGDLGDGDRHRHGDGHDPRRRRGAGGGTCR